MRHAHSFALAMVGPALSLASQDPVVSMSALTPLTIQAQLGAQQSANNTPAGALPPLGTLFTGIGSMFQPHAEAQLQWGASADGTVVGASFRQHLEVLGTSAGACGSGPQDFLLEIACAVARPVTLRVTLASTSTPGLPASTLEVDVDNDGYLDYWGTLFSGTFTRSAWIGPQPLRVRVRLAGGMPLGAQGTKLDFVALEVRPDNSLQILPTGAGCLDNSVQVVPAWAGHGVSMGPVSLPGPVAPFVFAVAGLGAQPLFLPSIGTQLPCLLIPEPDLVALESPFALGIPLAVRPVTVWLQYVVLQPSGGIGTSNAFAVVAN